MRKLLISVMLALPLMGVGPVQAKDNTYCENVGDYAKMAASARESGVPFSKVRGAVAAQFYKNGWDHEQVGAIVNIMRRAYAFGATPDNTETVFEEQCKRLMKD